MKMIKTLPLLLILTIGLTGCGQLENANQAASSQASRKIAPAGWSKILESIDKNDKQVKRFVVKESMTTTTSNIGNDYTMYGNVVLPDQFTVSMNLNGQSYYYAQDANETLIRDEGIWKHTSRVSPPMLWSTFDKLTKSKPPVVYQMPDAILISSPAEVYQFEGNAAEFADTLIRDQNVANVPALYTFYIDKKDRFLKKIEIKSFAGQEQIGTVVTDFSVEYSSINANNLVIQMPVLPNKDRGAASQ